MANHVFNRIYIDRNKTPKQTITAFMKRMPGTESNGDPLLFDFNNFVPQPDNIDFENAYEAPNGKVAWLSWRLKNWGTKWNPNDVKIMEIPGGELVIEFWTVNNGPHEVIEAIEKRYPTLVYEFVSLCEYNDAGENEMEGLYESEWYLKPLQYICWER